MHDSGAWWPLRESVGPRNGHPQTQWLTLALTLPAPYLGSLGSDSRFTTRCKPVSLVLLEGNRGDTRACRAEGRTNCLRGSHLRAPVPCPERGVWNQSSILRMTAPRHPD